MEEPHSGPLPARCEDTAGRMRAIALVLAGQLRDHFDSVFPSLNTTLLSMHDVKVDVFACVWETLDTDTSTRHIHDRQLNSTRKAFVTSQPWHLYGAKLAVLRIERSSQRAASVLHGLSIPTGLAKTAGRFSNSTLSHLWLQQCCRRELLLSSLSYDVVATIRPDSKWWLPEVAAGLVWCVRQLLNNRTWWQEASGKKHQLALFVSPIDQRSPEHASDRYAVGTPRAVLYYLDGWTSAPKYWAQPPSASPNRPSTSWARTPHNLLLVGERFVGWHLRNPHAKFEWGWMPMFHNIEDFPNAPTPNFFRGLARAQSVESAKRLSAEDCSRFGLPRSMFACKHDKGNLPSSLTRSI